MGNYQSNITFLSIVITNSYPIALDPANLSDEDKTFNINYGIRSLLVKEHCLNPIIEDRSIASLRLVCKTFKTLIDDYFKDGEVDDFLDCIHYYGEHNNIVENISFKFGFTPWWTIRQYIPLIKKMFFSQLELVRLHASDMGFNPYLTAEDIFQIMLIRGGILSPFRYNYGIVIRMIGSIQPANAVYLAKSFGKCCLASRIDFFLGIVSKIPKEDHKLLFLREFLMHMFSARKFYVRNMFEKALIMMKEAGACKKSGVFADPESEIWIHNVFNNGVFNAIIQLYDDGYLDRHQADFIKTFPGMWDDPEYLLIMSSISREMFSMVRYITESLKICEECIAKESTKPISKNPFLADTANITRYGMTPFAPLLYKIIYKMKVMGDDIERYGKEPKTVDFKRLLMRLMKILFINENSKWNQANNALDTVATEVFLAVVAKSKELPIWEYFLDTMLRPLKDCIDGVAMLPILFASIVPPLKSKRKNPEYVSSLISKLITYIHVVQSEDIFERFGEDKFIRKQAEVIELIKKWLSACKIKYELSEGNNTKKAKEIIKKLQEIGTSCSLGAIPFYMEHPINF